MLSTNHFVKYLNELFESKKGILIMNSMNILDIDDVLTWHEIYTRFIRDDPFWKAIETALSEETSDRFCEILMGLGYEIKYVEWKELVLLRHRCAMLLRENYTHVAAYHACRPIDVNSYLSRGIVPTNTEKLIEEAKKVFNDVEGVNKVVKKMDDSYFNHGRDKIGFFMSRTGSLESGYSHYLRYGSELVQRIASSLGNWAIQKLLNRGTPILFRCALPLSWLDEFTTFPMMESYALKPLEQLLVRLRWPNKQEFTTRGAFLLKRFVPKEYIIEAIDMTSFLAEKNLAIDNE